MTKQIFFGILSEIIIKIIEIEDNEKKLILILKVYYLDLNFDSFVG
jgi:hypothetical protein